MFPFLKGGKTVLTKFSNGKLSNVREKFKCALNAKQFSPSVLLQSCVLTNLLLLLVQGNDIHYYCHKSLVDVNKILNKCLSTLINNYSKDFVKQTAAKAEWESFP
jgi:hypothetical protein